MIYLYDFLIALGGVWGIYYLTRPRTIVRSYFHNSFGSLTSVKCLGLTAIGRDKPTETK